jgi:scyllo-inositol 2-dehydrogenase (NADP+)
MNVVFIGCGNITNSRHIPAVKRVVGEKNLSVGLIAVKTIDAEKTSRNFKSSRIFVGDILEGEIPDWLPQAELIIIGTPPNTHLPLIDRLLEIAPSSKILCEKPIGVDEDQINRFRTSPTLKINSNRLFIMHNFQFSQGFVKAKQIIASGKFGKVLNFHAHQYSSKSRGLPEWYENLPLGLFWDECSHFFYLANAICGEFKVEHVNASFQSRISTPNQLDINGRSPNKIPISFRMNFDAPISEWGCSIICERGVIFVDMFRDFTIAIKSDREHKTLDVLRSSSSFVFQFIFGFITSGWQYLIRKKSYGTDQVIEALVGKNPDNLELIRIEEGLRVIGQMLVVSSFLKTNVRDNNP